MFAVALLTVAACGGGTATEAPGPTQGGSITAAPTQAAPPVTAAPTQAAPNPTADPFAFVAQYEGAYSGKWTNTTYGSTGAAGVELKLDRAAGTIEFTITLGGNVFGQPAPKPEKLTATITPGQGLSFTSATFGETTISVDLAGASPAVTMTSPNVPSARIKTFTATSTIVDPNTIDLAYDVTFRDGTPAAHGTAKLTRS